MPKYFPITATTEF